ncbi:ABC transporter ATP-binding protein [Salininema proteolyticum]|uniref:ABC transporter ATP-binding protein n=1 Tax=Salininema proteolyticum TaxID=1607685 RepID=A0ABV8U2M4_9ACTN
MPEPILRLKGLEQVFQTRKGAVPAVGGVDIDITPGKVVCVVGESGCGKTTTARAAAGLARPTGGSVEYQGRDVYSLKGAAYKDFRMGVQYIHQDPYAALNPIRTVLSSLTAGLRRHRVVTTKKQARQRAAELLELVDLTPPETYLDKHPNQMSGGQRQRVNVARALALDPKVIIADEPTSMLDVSIRVSLLNTMSRLRDDLGVGFMMITHDLAVAKYFAWDGEIAVMYLGKVVEKGPTPQIINDPQHPYTKALIAAVCEPDPRLAKSGDKSGGLRSAEIPDLTDLPSGCSFHPRCPLFKSGDCDTVTPPLAELDGKRRLACTVVSRDHAQAAEKVAS